MRLRSLTVLLVVAPLVLACARSVSTTENALLQAGFQAQVAVTPQQKASLARLQPHRFSMQLRNGHAVWVYADPTICRCLYLGDQFAYDTYMARLRETRQDNWDQIVQMTNADNAIPYPFQWEDWGPGTPYY